FPRTRFLLRPRDIVKPSRAGFSRVDSQEGGKLDGKIRVFCGLSFAFSWLYLSLIAAELRDVPHDVTDGNHSDGPAVFDKRHVPIAADVHFVQCEGERFIGRQRFRFWSHKFGDWPFCVVGMYPGDLGEKIALAQNTDELTRAIHD